MAAWDIWAGTQFIVSEVDVPGADAGLMPRAPAGRQRAAGRQLMHNLAWPVRQAVISGRLTAAADGTAAGSRVLGRTPCEQRNHRTLHRPPDPCR